MPHNSVALRTVKNLKALEDVLGLFTLNIQFANPYEPATVYVSSRMVSVLEKSTEGFREILGKCSSGRNPSTVNKSNLPN